MISLVCTDGKLTKLSLISLDAINFKFKLISEVDIIVNLKATVFLYYKSLLLPYVN